ncbi:MAG: hypothetical protein AAF992_15880, partial [Bacteroidota bacterium]
MKTALSHRTILFLSSSCIHNDNARSFPKHNDNPLIFREVNNVFNASSPTISELKKLAKDDRVRAVNNLLASYQEKGFPLIEQDSLLEGYVYVTFIHIDATHQ